MELKIPQHRLLVYLLVLGLLPVIFAISKVSTLHKEAVSAKEALSAVYDKVLLAERREGQNKSVRKYFLEADHFYIDRQLEPLTFLEPEQNTLQQIISRQHVVTDEKTIKRQEFLSRNNKMSFTEGIVQTYPLFQETIETLSSPVEINVEDLKEILSKIEAINIDKHRPGINNPQLIVTFFKLDKKKISEKNEVFELNLKLLKREFL